MLKVLINSYACCPNMGSEQGMGWNWIVNIAKYCECFVITESEYRKQIEDSLTPDISEADAVNEFGLSVTQINNLHFYFVAVGDTEEESAKIRQMCWDQGNWAFYPKYAVWQEKVLTVARSIVAENGIDVMHQLNMAGFREPGMLYRINEERVKDGLSKIPLVWGPFTGYGSIPFSFMRPGGMKFTSFYLVKNMLNWMQLVGHHRVRKMVKVADCLIAATPEMKDGMEKYYGRTVLQINETGCYNVAESNDIVKPCKKEDGTFRICWVGRFLYTKQLDLALRVVAEIKDIDGIQFHIVGEGVDEKETRFMHQKAKELGVEEICTWHGRIPNREVHELMRQSDIFFFTSIFEATSTVILEAIQNRLPIVCFDRCGFGPLVDESIGRKIPCNTPKQSVRDFSRIIRELAYDRKILDSMAPNFKAKQNLLEWDTKIQKVVAIYTNLVEKVEG